MKITPASVLAVLSDGKGYTTFQIAEKIVPMSTDLDAQRVYAILRFQLQGKVRSDPGSGKFFRR